MSLRFGMTESTTNTTGRKTHLIFQEANRLHESHIMGKLTQLLKSKSSKWLKQNRFFHSISIQIELDKKNTVDGSEVPKPTTVWMYKTSVKYRDKPPTSTGKRRISEPSYVPIFVRCLGGTGDFGTSSKRWENPGSVYGFKEIFSCSINVTYIIYLYQYIQKVHIFTSVHCMATVDNIRYHIVGTCKAI